MKVNVTMEGTVEEINDLLDKLLHESKDKGAYIDFERLVFTEEE